MNDFEDKIRNLPWRKASGALRDRIFETNRPMREERQDRSLSFKWSIMFATAAGFIGFLIGTTMPGPSSQTQVASAGTDIRVVETSSARNSFDFSGDAIQILPGEFVAHIDEDGETTR